MKAIILAGGLGTRLFPLSRKNLPKQFLKLGDGRSLLQQTILRLLNLVQSPTNLIISTNKEYIFHLKTQLKELGLSDREIPIITEPEAKNTAPAIALAVKYLIEKHNVSLEEVVLVSPSDHIIKPEEKFLSEVKRAKEFARMGYIVTFGITPTKPETGYGYIEAGEPMGPVFKVKRFHEKPSLTLAQEYLSKGNFFWNSGMFAFSLETLIEELRRHAEDIYNLFVETSFEVLQEKFHKMPDISIDYAIMEKTDRAVVLPLNLFWSDVGSWESVYEVLPHDENGNAKSGNIIDLDTKNCLILGNKRLISTIGVEDLIIVETDDVILITKKGSGQRIREVVSRLKQDKELNHLTELHPTVYRPWGHYIELEKGKRHKIKRITVYPGESLSLQMHYHRSEHWIVVKGTAKVVLEKDGEVQEYFVHENQSIYVPKTTKHRLMNPGKIPLEIIEVQVGEYIEEDDIVRFDDVYGRC